jgi:transcriptional regulator with XRE-family HTH domain
MEASADRDPRRAEMADLLRSRREHLSAERLGVPVRGRRRTPGLRREEVAELAGISVALYTWLEQGREVPVSVRTIDAVATALQLSPGERSLLHRLVSRETVVVREEVTPTLCRFVRALPGPAFVLDRGWDIVLRNAEAGAVFGGSTDLDERRNILVDIYTNPEQTALFTDHEQVAESVLAMFRFDYAARIDDPRTQELVERLRATVPAFESAWHDHRVSEHPGGVREIVHPEAGQLMLAASMYDVAESPGLRILAFTPANPLSAERIARLTEKYHAVASATRSWDAKWC